MACWRVCARVVVVVVVVLTLVENVGGHGRLMDPPARNSMWRLGFNNPVNYNDNELYCGGRMVQWLRNGGKCGVCGDAWHGDRDHEAGGKFANGIITRTYHQGDVMPVTVHLTANHQGWFEFRICPVNDPKKRVTQECLDKHVLQRADGGGEQFPVPKGKYNAFFNYTVQLPPDLTCKQCVIQWKYRTGNTWDKDDNSGVFCLGCGPQEEFYNCADIEILRGARPPDMPIEHLPMPNMNDGSDSGQYGQAEKDAQTKDANHKDARGKDAHYKEAQHDKDVEKAGGEQDWHVPKGGDNQVVKETHDKSLWDKKRDNDVKGHLANTVDRPKEDKYSWHAASPISWAVIANRLATPGPSTTMPSPTPTTPKVPAPGVTPRRSIFTPHPTATKRQSSFTRRPATPQPLYTWFTRKNPETDSTSTSTSITTTTPATKTTSPTSTTPSTTTHLYLHHSDTTLTPTPSHSTHSARPLLDRSRATRRHRMPSWLVRVAERMKENQNSNKQDQSQATPDLSKEDDDIHARRERFRQRLWRHLTRSSHRRQHDDTNIVHYKGEVERKSTTAREAESTKVTPTCVTESKRTSQQQDTSETQVFQQDTPRAQVYQHQTLSVRPRVSLQHAQTPGRWWHGYNGLVWSTPQAVGGGQLRCRATVHLGGGMDEWCTANCNANYCPASMCVCTHSQDAWSPTYEVYHPHSPAWIRHSPYPRFRTAYRGITPLRSAVQVPDSSQRAEVPSKSIFSPPAGYNAAHKKSNTEDLRATYPPFSPREQEVDDTKHVMQTRQGGVGGSRSSTGYVLTSGWERKRMVCRAVGRYAGLAEYDEWCSNNCAQAMCPLMMCQCDTF